MHRVLIDDMPAPGQAFRVAGEEGRHAARVKRLEPGEPVELLDGRGHVASAIVRGSQKSGPRGEWTLLVDVHSVTVRAPVEPRLDVYAPAPKGERLEAMIDALSQVGAASWSPLHCARAVIEPREYRLERLNRIAREAAKQCGRAWSLRIDPPCAFEAALSGEPGSTILADATGRPFHAGLAPGSLSEPRPELRLLVGPEGGWDPRELARAERVGAVICSFGPHTMRIEQAAVVGSAIIMHALAGAASAGS